LAIYILFQIEVVFIQGTAQLALQKLQHVHKGIRGCCSDKPQEGHSSATSAVC
jgi:hypothetical protein